MSDPDRTSSAEPTIIKDATCLACGCLCDDIGLTVAEGWIVNARNACEVGRAWFLKPRDQERNPPATIEGRPVEIGEAISRAAEVLAGARCPIVLGGAMSTVEAQAAAVALADRIGATIDLGRSADSIPRIRALQRVGRVSATLGEVRGRADLIVFWGVDPITSHPRFWERFVEPAGRFVPEGRSGRTILVADTHRTATAERADRFLPLAPESWFGTLWALRALIQGVDLEPEEIERAASGDELRAWAHLLRQARYGAMFTGPEFGREGGGAAVVEAAWTVVRDLNTSARFVALELGGPGTASGAEEVLTWQTGFPCSVDFGGGFPRFLPGEATAAERLGRGEADAALILGDDPRSEWTPAAREHLDRIPTVVIAPNATDPVRSASIGLASATPGIHESGTVVRSDGVSLPLRSALASKWPSEREWIKAIENALSPET